MAEYEPYTKEERERLVASMERWNMLGQDRVIEVFAGAVVIEVRRYEATVVALEAEVARLRPLAEVGEAVEAMPVGFGLSHAAQDVWLTWDNRGLDDEVDETCGQTALATLQELAACAPRRGRREAEYKPLTKEDRETHAAFCERQLRLRTDNTEMAILHDMAQLSLRYEETVKDREDRIAALEADNARLGGLVTDQVVTKLPESQ